MKSSNAVIDTSPWIALSACGQISLLRKLYDTVMIPITVNEEILAGGKSQIGLQELNEADWLQVVELQDPMKVMFLHELDQGEAEVIILAKEQKVHEVILDEKVARIQARVPGLTVVGTLGLLLRAKKQGLLREIRPLIEEILRADIYIHRDIVQGVFQKAGE